MVDLRERARQKLEPGNYYLFDGTNIIARRLKRVGYWEWKTSECSRCGKCCQWDDGDIKPCPHHIKGDSITTCGIFSLPTACRIEGGEGVVDGCTVKWSKKGDMKWPGV